MCRTLVCAFAAAHTFFVVDMSHIVFHCDGTDLTLLFAEFASDTSDIADLLDRRAAILVGASHRTGGFCGNEFDQMLGAGGDTFAAGLTFGSIYPGYAVDHMDGVERTGSRTGAKAKTAEVAFPGIEAAADGGGTIFNSDVVAFGNGMAAVSAAFYKSNLFFTFFGFYAHDVGDLLAHGIAAHRTAVYRSFSCYNGGSHGVTSCVAASAAVIAGKELPYGSFPGIGFYFKFIAHDYQKHSDQETDNGNRDSCNNN